MRATYDPEAKALYVYVSDEHVADHTVEIAHDSINADFDADNALVGYEFVSVDLEIIG